ncbi:helix-turn-helix transcriptional regulator [Qipengyuania marisflavi]|uniref:Helix-turn-helix transcriptional regulator n=2 Tax=Qipengyuania marisflavi TaxID=2486356 RepID=A0A5S3PZ49_9SPHN|nr:helix-turn-helix transcriptional regulator [Qipengyuania marisflavi]
MAANSGRHGSGKNWGSDWGDWSGGFGPDGPFGPKGPFGPDGPFGPGGPFGKGGRGGGRRRGRMFGSGELRLLLLHLIAEEPRHGYELIKAIEEMTGGHYAPSPGTVYPTLSLLEDEGAIRQATGGDEARKDYEATDSGRAELEERSSEVESLLERLTGHAEKRGAFATPEMFRAAGNLAAVLKNRARSGDLNDAKIAEIVDLVDDLAKKIERL